MCSAASLSVHRPTSRAHPQSHRAKEKEKKEGCVQEFWPDRSRLVHLIPILTVAYFTLPRGSRNTRRAHLPCPISPSSQARTCLLLWRRDPAARHRRPPVADRLPINSVVAFTECLRRPDAGLPSLSSPPAPRCSSSHRSRREQQWRCGRWQAVTHHVLPTLVWGQHCLLSTLHL